MIVNRNNFVKLVVAIGASELTGVVGWVFTVRAIPTWYAALEKSSLTPPGWVFGPVWIILYFLMGVEAFLIWRRDLPQKEFRNALLFFSVQLLLNALWPVLFFGLRNPMLAFGEILLLWFAIVAMTLVFARISHPAALLLLPYLCWVSFAAYLNYAVWMLN